VIDVRDDEEYVAGHIPGARHMPVDMLAARYGELPGRQLHVTYCNMRHRANARSLRAAALLRQRGRRARALAGGFPAWAAAGYPIERGLPA
jgi:rhodanese-related sulfurtransferase